MPCARHRLLRSWSDAEAAIAELGLPLVVKPLDGVATKGVCRVRTIDEVYAWEQTRSQGLLIEVDHGTLGPVQLAGPPLRFFDPDGREVTRTAHAAPPTLDGDGAAVRAWLAGTAAP